MLEALSDLAEAAGRRIMSVYDTDFDVHTKDDDSPLTAADLAAHRCIMGGLARMSPGVPVLSEESANVPWSTRRSWDTYWIVDPLDGTKEFINRRDEFTVNIALIQGGEPVAGVVSAPALGETFVGARDQGARKRCGAGPWKPIQVRPASRRAPRVMASRSHRSAALDAALDQLPGAQIVSAGSSLKFCRIAEGQADLYPRLGLTSEWDTAAAHAVLSAAGGSVNKLDGTPLRYNHKRSVLNPYFLAAGAIHADLADLFFTAH